MPTKRDRKPDPKGNKRPKDAKRSVKDLAAKKTDDVRGGRKAGETPLEY